MGVSLFQREIAPDFVTLVDKSLAQPGAAHVRAAFADPDIANLRRARVLRTCHERPSRRRAEKSEEIAPSHCLPRDLDRASNGSN